jgi:AcrR family transcriptional regulator
LKERAGPPGRLSAAERREQILDATKELARERGFHRVSIDAVARAAGITRPIVYQHFGDLTGLLNALVDREGERAMAQLTALLPTDLSSGDPRAILAGALRAFLEAVHADPTTWRLVLMPAEGTPEALRERFVRERTAVTGQLAAAVDPYFTLGPSGDSPDPELTARVLQAIAEELARLTLDDPARYPVERLVEYADWLLGTIIAGAAADG